MDLQFKFLSTKPLTAVLINPRLNLEYHSVSSEYYSFKKNY